MWKAEEGGEFTVKSSYLKLEKLLVLEEGKDLQEKKVFKEIWKSLAPSRVVAFSWKLLLDGISTRRNLARRFALPPKASIVCVFYGHDEESSIHLFLHCEVTCAIWREFMTWLGISFITPLNIFIHWECCGAVGRDKKLRRGLRFIWRTTIWVIWQARNNFIFKNVVSGVDELVEEINVLSWRWSLGRLKLPT